jgi:hypothetical protein
MYKSTEKGMSTMELTLALPLIVFVLLFLIGMGYALMTKSFVIIGAQYAGNYQRIFNAVPTEREVGMAVSREGENIQVSGGAQGGEIHYIADTTLQKGLLAYKYHPGQAAAQYYTISGTGICPSGTFLTPCITYKAK